MKKWLLSLCMILALAACDNKKEEAQADSKPVIKIGAILPLTGSQADMGKAAKAGMYKAIDEQDKSSLHYDYQFVFEDNQAKLASMPAIANKMIMQDNVDAIGMITSAMARVVAPIADQKGKVLYAYSIEEENYQAFGKYTFIQGISTEAIADKLIHLFRNDKLDNISVFAENIGVLGSLTSYLDKKLSQIGIKYEINTFNPGEIDFRIALEKSKSKGFTNFFEVGFPPERDIIIKQMGEAGISNQNIYSFSLDLGKSSVAYDGMKTVSYNQGTVDFIKSIQQKYNIDNVYGSAAFYDFVNIVVEACENLYKNGQNITAEEITTYIHNKKQYKCASGECLVNQNGFILNQPIVRLYEGDDWQEIEE